MALSVGVMSCTVPRLDDKGPQRNIKIAEDADPPGLGREPGVLLNARFSGALLSRLPVASSQMDQLRRFDAAKKLSASACARNRFSNRWRHSAAKNPQHRFMTRFWGKRRM